MDHAGASRFHAAASVRHDCPRADRSLSWRHCLKRSEENLRSSEADLQEAQRVARLGSWTVETATGKVTWTDELYRMLGFDPSVRVPSLAERERILAPESWKRMNEEFEETLRTGIPFELEIETVRPNGSTRWILIRGAPKRDAYGDLIGLCGIAQDITERKQVEKQVQYLAYFDSLTGLPNRRLLQDRLAKAIAGAQRRDERIAVLFFDLDRFKIINDSPRTRRGRSSAATSRGAAQKADARAGHRRQNGWR